MAEHTKVILITGASSGMGYEAAKELARQGHKVYGGARRVERVEELRDDGVIPIRLDVTSEEECERTIERVVAEQGRIDVLINNAGYGSYGAVEDVDIEEARRQFEVNVLGVATLIKAVMPHMRARRSGTIINTSSMGGRLVSFMGGWYHATKYALEALSDTLRRRPRSSASTLFSSNRVGSGRTGAASPPIISPSPPGAAPTRSSRRRPPRACAGSTPAP